MSAFPLLIYPQIFDRFFRAISSRSQVEGNGLGLAIAKWLAEMHHADLSVVSAENKGTTFQIVFPVDESSGKPVDVWHSICQLSGTGGLFRITKGGFKFPPTRF